MSFILSWPDFCNNALLAQSLKKLGASHKTCPTVRTHTLIFTSQRAHASRFEGAQQLWALGTKWCWWTTTQYVISWGLTGSTELVGVNKIYFSWSWQIKIYWRVLISDECQCDISIKWHFKVYLTVKLTRSSLFPSISIMHSRITWREKLRMGENVGELFLKQSLSFRH